LCKPLKKIVIVLASLLGVALLFVIILGVAFLIVNKINGTLVSSGEKRQYLLHVPASYDRNVSTPLVISIHGFAEWPAHQAQISRWNDLADEKGFIVVYPSGTSFPKRWRTTGLTDSPGDPELDIRFISDLIYKLSSDYNIDPNRIYANGLSNGGGMSYLLACKMADRIAAIGSVAGAYTYPPDLCKPSRPVPLIAFHGDADPVVPYFGGPSRSFEIPFPYIPDWMQAWADRNKCQTTSPIPQDGEISSTTWSECNQGADVTFYTIAGGGHSWPGGEPIPEWIVGNTSQAINATRVMWQFFEHHPLK
jgi:polyhydroxybutyrate depolymerase